MTATAAAAAAIDGDVQLLLLATNVTGEQMNAQLPEIRDSLARRATAAALAATHPTITTTDDLDALPAGTVVRSDTIACRFDTDHGVVLGDDRPPLPPDGPAPASHHPVAPPQLLLTTPPRRDRARRIRQAHAATWR